MKTNRTTSKSKSILLPDVDPVQDHRRTNSRKANEGTYAFAWVPHLESKDICAVLEIGDRIYMARRFLSYTGGLNPSSDKVMEVNRQFFVPFNITRKPVFFAHGGNWCFEVTTNAFLLGIKNSRKTFNERIFLNDHNLADFLFHESKVALYLDFQKKRDYTQFFEEEKKEAERKKAKEERAKKGKFAMATPSSKPALWKDQHQP